MGVRRTTAAFTLLELMLVVALLGTFATMAATAVGPWMADARQQRATFAVLQLAREAYALSQRSGKAQRLTFDQTASNGLGTLERRGAIGSNCIKAIWPQAADERYDMATVNIDGSTPGANDTDRNVIRLVGEVSGVGQNRITLCAEPSGRTYLEVPPNQMEVQTDLVRLTVERTLNGTQVGVPRTLIFEAGSQARLQR